MANIGNILKIGGSILAGLGGAASVAVSVPTVVKNMQQPTAEVTNVVEEYNINNVHTITYSDTYLINGEEVDEATFLAWLENQGTIDHTPKTETINSSSFDIDGIARLAEYIDFEFDRDGNVYSATIISDKVLSIEYDYAQTYVADGLEYYTETGNNMIYQDINDGIYGKVFTVGTPTESNYLIEYTTTPETLGAGTLKNYTIFYFREPVGNTRPLQFYEVFDSITLTIAR